VFLRLCLEEFMERMMEKLAKQLNSFDEASLLSLWGNFAARVERFEPTQRWEEAALCLCLCQAVRWKNQLFNHHFTASLEPSSGLRPNEVLEPLMPPRLSLEPQPLRSSRGQAKKRVMLRPGKVLAFDAAVKADKPQKKGK